jgi:hypothetical protein
MRVGAGVLVAASLAVAILSATAQTPTPVVERITDHFGRTTRVSLFSNHVVIVAIRSDTEDFIHQATLSFDEYMVYLQALEQCARELGNEPVTSDVQSRDSTTELILHVGPDAPRIIKYSPLASLKLPAGKIASMMDDIQIRALAALPGELEIKQWAPEIGDCVELRRGGEACVTAVGDEGTIVLTQKDSSVSFTIAEENRVEVVLRVIEPEP